MELIEYFSCSADPRFSPNEDLVYFDGRFAAVIDGASEEAGLSYEGLTGGEWAARQIADTLHAAVDGISPEEFARYASERVGDGAHRIHPHLELDLDTPAPSAQLCVYSADRRELWRIGETAWWMREPHRGGEFEIRSELAGNYPRALAHARAALIEMWLARGMSPDQLIVERPEAEALRPWIWNQHKISNDPNCIYSQALVDGSPIPAEMIEITPVPAGIELVLTTDGYPEVFSTVEATELALQEDLAEDPLRIGRNPAWAPIRARGSSFDDRSYLRLRT